MEEPRAVYDLVGALADFPVRREPPTQSIVICTLQRSGSTLLGEAIYFAESLGCPLEYFHPGFRPLFAKRWQQAEPNEFIAALHRHRTSPSGIFSIKLFWRDVMDFARERGLEGLPATTNVAMPDDMYRRIFAVLLEAIPNPRFVFLTRQDQLRQAVSLHVAGETGRWRELSERGDVTSTQTEYRFIQIAKLLAAVQRHRAHWMNFFRANKLNYYSLAYEDLERDYDGTLRKFFAAIGQPDAKIATPRLHKQAGTDSERLIELFMAEFREKLRDSAPQPGAVLPDL
ncbi:MAG TPA: Stf0 family sulfotransferase [Pseudolabrys sp.]|nr:Stf0 family sulfotransferase [Pseudolabrys sp.]